MTKLLHVGIFVLFFIGLSLGQGPQYEKVVNNLDAEAKCLDGSPPALYVHQGSEPANIIIFFEGSAPCNLNGLGLNESLAECVRRTNTS